MFNKSLNILYIQIDEQLIAKHEIFLQKNCTKLFIAKDNLIAKEYIDNNNIDVLIIDIDTPNLDVIEFIDYIKRSNKDVQIIAISTFSNSDYFLKLINEGVSKYILKPFKAELLKKTLDETIEYINVKKENLIQKRKLDLIINNISSSIFLLDYDLNIVKTNKIATDDFKINNYENQSIFHSISSEDKEFKEILTKTIFEEKKIENIEIQLINKLNNKLSTKINAVLLEEERLILLTIKNSTTLVKYEKLIKKYVQTLDKHVMSLRVDTDFSIIYASKAFCKYLGYEKFELIGKRINNFLEDSTFINSIPSDIKNSDEIKYQQKIINSNFDSKWVEIIFTNLTIWESNVGYSIIIHDINDKKILQNTVIKDSLTGLYNRRYLNEIKDNFLNSAKRNEDFVSFCVLDIDDFKLYNDNYGHQKGDDALIKVGEVLKNIFKRANDYAFRIGGEEFILLFRSEDENNAVTLGEKVIKKIKDLNIEHNKSSKNILTASMGIYTKKSNEVDFIDDMYINADKLLYKAKASGKNICLTNL